MGTPVFKLRSLSITDSIVKGREVVIKMTGNPKFAAPAPKLSDITGDINDLETKYNNAANGDRVLKKLMRIAQAKYILDMGSLAGYIQSVALGDDTIILSSGAELKSSRTPKEILPPPVKLRGAYGKTLGSVVFRWAGVKGRLEYVPQFNSTPADETKWEDLSPTGKNRYLLENRVSAKEYAFRVATRSTKGTGINCDAVIHRAL